MGLNDRTTGREPPRPRGRGGSLRSLKSRRTETGRAVSTLERLGKPLGEAVIRQVLSGRGVLLAQTSDGGALSITVYDGDDRERAYPSSPEELEALIEALDALPGTRDYTP